MLTRKDEHLVGGNRPSMTQQVRAGATQDGRFIAYDLSGYGTGGIGSGAGFTGPYVYHVPNYRTEKSAVAINAGSARAMRAPGPSAGCLRHGFVNGRTCRTTEHGPLRISPHQQR